MPRTDDVAVAFDQKDCDYRSNLAEGMMLWSLNRRRCHSLEDPAREKASARMMSESAL